MARTTIRIELPANSPDELVTLLEGIATEHDRRETEQPESSPLDADEVAQIKAVVASAKPDRKKARELTAQAAALYEVSNKTLGLAKGQDQRTEGTGLYLAAKVRDGLAVEFRGNENELEKFGFGVVVGSAKSPVRKAVK